LVKQGYTFTTEWEESLDIIRQFNLCFYYRPYTATSLTPSSLPSRDKIRVAFSTDMAYVPESILVKEEMPGSMRATRFTSPAVLSLNMVNKLKRSIEFVELRYLFLVSLPLNLCLEHLYFLSLINSPTVLFNPIVWRAVKICFIVPEILRTNKGFFIVYLRDAGICMV